MRDAAAGAKLQIGKAAVSTTPTIDFRSSGQAPNYDVQMIVSGGTGTDGNGTIRINTGEILLSMVIPCGMQETMVHRLN